MTQRYERLLALATLLTIAVAAPAGAQPITDPAAHLVSAIVGRAAQIRTIRAKAASTPLGPDETALSTIGLQTDLDSIYLRLYLALSDSQLRALEERRADKQIGEAAGSTAGSTSLVSKGGTPAILALAVENGALAQDVSGTTVTVRGTPASIVRALGNTGYFQTLRTDDPAVALLQKFSFAASFDTSRGVPEGGQRFFTADRGQFAGASARFSAVDRKDPRAAVNDPRWSEFAATQLDLDAAALKAFQEMRNDPAINAWVVETQEAIADAPLEQVEAVVTQRFGALGAIAVAPATQVAIRQAGQQFEALLKRRAEVIRDIEGGAQLVFDWNYQRPVTESESSNLKVVGSVGRSILLTGNTAVTLYHGTVPAEIDRLRDIQAALQLDIPFGDPEAAGRYVVSLATKVQHMPKDVMAPEGALFPGTKGTIWLVQTKLTIPVRGTAARIPLSLTVANRTELIAEKKTFARANIGFSYDLDAVFARFKP